MAVQQNPLNAPCGHLRLKVRDSLRFFTTPGVNCRAKKKAYLGG